MTVTIAVIYGTESGISRRVVASDELTDLAAFVQSGESMVYTDMEEMGFPTVDGLPDPNRVEQIIAQAIGREPETARCRVVNDATGETVDFIMADPRLDVVEGHTLFQDAEGAADWIPGPDGWEPPPPEEGTF